MGAQASGSHGREGQRGALRKSGAHGASGPRRGRRARVLSGAAFLLPFLLGGAAGAKAQLDSQLASWWNDNFEVHGFVTSKAYFRSPDFGHAADLSSWRNELNLETELRLHEGDLRMGLFSVLRPTWDGIYEVRGDTWGEDLDRAAFGTSPAYPNDPFAGAQFPNKGVRSFAGASGRGKGLPCGLAGLSANCGGARVDGEFSVVNSDTGTFFRGRLVPAIAIDDTVFFGRVTAPFSPRGRHQEAVGGNATGNTYADLRDNFPVFNAGLPALTGLDASLRTFASMPLSTPLNAYQGGIGDIGSLRQASVDFNREELDLALDCGDNAHPWCWVRELYIEASYKNSFLRIGRQQIVWGKTDAFRLQDRINPIDLGYHNIFPDLEERRIPVLALDAIQGFGDVGPFQDVSLEFAWVFDRFIPDQFGQCGEPYAFTAACGARADAGAHGLFNFAIANVDERHWTFENTEPGLRLDFRIPEPSIAFSVSGFYTFQDTPVARFRNHYSVSNPNPATMLFLQGLFSGGAPVAVTIDTLAAAAPGLGGPSAYSGGVWLGGFDPYAHNVMGAPIGTLAAANGDLQNAWYMLTNILPQASGGCAGLAGGPQADCIAGISTFALPWSTSEVTLEYPRIWALGASMDYQVPGIDTVLRMELASDIDRRIQDTSRRDGVSNSSVFLAAVGLDRSTFIPFLNRERTAFISAQTFIEHIVDYRDKGGVGGMIPRQTSVISTIFMQNFWRNDSIILTNFAAFDWQARAVATGPSLRWVYNSNLFFDVGVNLLWGQGRKHNLRNVCADASLSCIGDPTTWQDGNWQTLNAGLRRSAEHPWWAQESFADKFMRKRDEFWIGVTYQF